MCSIPGLPTSGSQANVVITRVNLNSTFGVVELWVNMDDRRKQSYELMRENIQIPKRKFYGSEGKPEDLCVVCISGSWHRARIVSIQSETYNVFLIDQGQYHVTTSKDLAWAQIDSFFLPPEIESCILANVVMIDKNLPEKASHKFLLSFAGKKLTGTVQDVLLPERIILLDIPDLSMFICKFGIARNIPTEEFKCLAVKYVHLPKGEVSKNVCLTLEQNLTGSGQLVKHDQYFYPELSTGAYEVVDVTEVTDQLDVFCKLVIFSKAVKILSEQIHQHYEESSTSGERPQTCGAPCAAKGADGRWHRSLLKQSIAPSQSAAEIFHVDKGITELVPVEDIRPLLEQFIRRPVFTYYCSLVGIKENNRGWTTDEKEKLKLLLMNQSVVAKFDKHNLSQDVYDVTLFSANATCINNSFLEEAGLIPPSKPEQGLHMENQSTLSSFLTSLRAQQCLDSQNKAIANNNGVPEETLPSTKGPDPSRDNSVRCSGDHQSEVQSDNVPTVGRGFSVKVCCIESPQAFWCQKTENGDSLECLTQDLQKHYASVHPQPIVESICVARNPDDNMWHRVKIIANNHSPVVDVRFIDYGQTRKVPLQHVRPIDPAFLQLNAQAFQCCLFNLTNPANPSAISCSDAASTEFQKFVDLGASSETGLKCVVKAVVYDEDGLMVNLVDIETASDSACKLLAQKCVQSKAHVQIPPQIPSSTYSFSSHNIEIGGTEKIWVTSSESVNLFYCQLDRNSHINDKVTQHVSEQLDQPQCVSQPLRLGSVCIAKYTDKKWYRGQVVELSPKLKVQFVDFGDTLAVNEADIRPFLSEESIARSVPVLAVPLGLSDVPTEIPQEVNQWFADQATGQEFTISVVAIGKKGKLIVEMFDGSLNVNALVRKKITMKKPLRMPDFIQKIDLQLSDSSKQTFVNNNCFPEDNTTVEVQQHGLHSKSGTCDRHELEMNPKSTNDAISAPENEQHSLDVNLQMKDSVAETITQSDNSELGVTQPFLSFSTDCNVSITYKKPNISQNKTEEMYATCIVGPHYFWCQKANSKELARVSEFAQVAGQAQEDVFTLETLEPGSPCLALFSDDNQWYRAQVIRKLDRTLNVLFVDYGNESEVDIENVRPLPQSLLEIAPQACLCHLNGFDESKGSWDDEAYDGFYNLLVDKPIKVTIFNIENFPELAVPRYAVEIQCDKIAVNTTVQKYWKSFSEEHPKNETDQMETSPQGVQLLENITQLDLSKGNVDTCICRKKKISLNKTEKVYASFIDGPSFFWCQYADTEDLTKLSELAQEAGDAEQDTVYPESLGPGSPCLALFSSDNKWYRAQVIHKVDNIFHVVFIDYGNESEVDIGNLRSLPQSLLEISPQAFLCCLSGFNKAEGSWADGIYDNFYNLLIDKLLQLKVLSVEDHSEIRLPQYSVEIEYEGVLVNSVMQKYWEPATAKNVPTEELLQGGQTQSNTKCDRVSEEIMSTCLYKEPKISKAKLEMVYVSCIAGPHFFWCQGTNTDDLNKLSELVQEVGQPQGDMMFIESLGPGSPCLALFSSDNKWYRAQVIHKVDNIFHVVFIDYGNESEVDMKNVRSLPQSLLEIAPQAFLCCLGGFDKTKGSWADEVYDNFYNLLINKLLQLRVVSVEDHSEVRLPQYSVEIICEGVLVNTAMRNYWKPGTEKCFTTENHQPENLHQGGQIDSYSKHDCVSEENVSSSLYKEPTISKTRTEMVYASCISEPHYFWCQGSNTEDLNKLSGLAQEAGRTPQEKTMCPETLGPGSPCLALFSSDNKWYRAQIIHKIDDSFHVVFIDYGNESEVDMKNVRSLPQSLLEIAPQAFLCCLSGFDKTKGSWTDEVFNDFYNRLIDKPLKLTVMHVEDHSETTGPQYAVEIESEGMLVNKLMEKYWKEFDREDIKAESSESVDQEKTRTVDERVAISNG